MILVTGATGYVGRAVVHRLRSLGIETVAMVRDVAAAGQRLPSGIPLRLAAYADGSALKRAFAGADQVILISSDGDARAVMNHHANAISEVAAAGVSRVVFTSIVDVDPESSFYFAPVYRDAEARLAASGVPAIVVRCGLYSDFILQHWLEPNVESGEVVLAAGRRCVAPISRDDVAAAIVAIASQAGTNGSSYTVTGFEALTVDEIVAAFSEVAHQRMRYFAASSSEYLAWAWRHLEDPWPHAFSTLCASLREGRYSHVTNDFAELVGRKPESFAQFLRRAFRAIP